MYTPECGIVPYKFKAFKEIHNKRRLPKRFYADFLSLKRPRETQDYAGRREDVEQF